MTPNPFTTKAKKERFSKTLTYLLRHGAVKEGLDITDDGYVPIEQIAGHSSILKLQKQFNICLEVEHFEYICETCPKQRYKMKTEDNITYMRANQGHTKNIIKSAALLASISLDDVKEYPIVCHGTYRKAWLSIRKTGLNRMTREHIHLSTFEPDDAGMVSGMRSSSEIIVYLDLASAIKAGLRFFVSANKVILSEGDETGSIPIQYFTKAIDRKTGEDLLLTDPFNCNGQDSNFLVFLHLESSSVAELKSKKVTELVELSVSIMNTATLTTVDTFHRYIKPSIQVVLSESCIKYSGVTQEMVDSANDFKMVLKDFQKFLSCNDLNMKNMLFVTCGIGDLKGVLPAQCRLLSMDVPKIFSNWIDIVPAFTSVYPKVKIGKRKSIDSILDVLKVPQHERGKTDVDKLSLIATHLIQSGYWFRKLSSDS